MRAAVDGDWTNFLAGNIPSSQRTVRGTFVLLISLAWTLEAFGVPSGGVLFHASFDNTTAGTDGRGRAVLPLSAPDGVTYAAGKQGRALMCGGDNGTLVRYPVAGHLWASQGTVAMWVKAVKWPKNDRFFHVFFETQGPGWLVLYKYYTGGLVMLSGADHAHYGSALLESEGPLADGRWHHLAGVWDRKRLSLYSDGVLRKTLPAPPLPKNLEGFFTVGDAPWGTPQGDSRTLIDEVTVYSHALPDDQIARLANGRPLTFQPSIRVDVQPWPSRGQWKVIVSAAGFTVGDGGKGVQAAVQVLDGSKVRVAGAVRTFNEGQGNVLVNIASIPTGTHTVRAIVQDAAGREVARGELAFTKPADAPWVNNSLGMTDRVLAPFTVMNADNRTRSICCWGRRYTMNGPFPTQIESDNQSLLAQPMELHVATPKGPVAFTQSTGRITRSSPTRVCHVGSADSPAFHLTTATTIEYDGMLWTELTLTPKSATKLTNVTLHIPVKAAHAIFLHHARADFAEDNAGFLPDGGYGSLDFQPYLWVGDNDRGLAWFAESRQGWSTAVGVPVQRIARTGDTVEMQIAFINQPVSVSKPLHLAFGLQATPVKPRPADARRWRLCGVGADLDAAGMGNLQIVWPNGNQTYYGYPEAKNADKFRAYVADRHRRGIRVVTYLNLNFLSVGVPEWAYYSHEWVDPSRSFTGGDVGQMGYATYGACPHSKAWRDFIAYRIAEFVDEYQVDGIYVDCWSGNECLEEDHGCGWRDANGVLHGHFPFRDYREILRRVREILQDRRPNPHVLVHMSGTVIIPIDAFADSMLDGEQYQGIRGPNDDYLGAIPLDKWRAEHTGRPWGVVPFFLPEFVGDNRTATAPTDRMMGIMLAHDISPWATWCNPKVVFDTWKQVDQFGIDNAAFLPYWTSNGVTVTGNSKVVASAYRLPGRVLLAILNSDNQSATVTVNVDGNRLLGGSVRSAWNAADNSSIPVIDQRFTLSGLPGRTYKLVTLSRKTSFGR